MKTYTYTIHLEPTEEGGFTVTVPALPGCITEGDTVPEAIARAEECIRGFLTALAKAGKPIPSGDDPRQPIELQVAVKVPATA
jgi:predicted RNase H-like HicB family nuclease